MIGSRSISNLFTMFDVSAHLCRRKLSSRVLSDSRRIALRESARIILNSKPRGKYAGVVEVDKWADREPLN